MLLPRVDKQGYESQRAKLSDGNRRSQDRGARLAARNHSLSNKIMSRLKDLEREYNELRELHRWNEFVEGFQINCQTRLNQDYYLYESGTRKFLSLISPQEMGDTYTYHGRTRLHSEGYFVKVEEERSIAKS